MATRHGPGGAMAAGDEKFKGCVDEDADCAVSGVVAQADWDVALAKEIMIAYPEHGGALLGGFLMGWTDEYWRGGNVKDKCVNPCPVANAETCRTQKLSSFLPGGIAQCSHHAHFTCDNPDTTYHDLCGYFLYSAPDHYVNEEWFGISTPVSCGLVSPKSPGLHLDSLSLRPVYYAMQELWSGTDSGDPLACSELVPCYHCLKAFTAHQVDAGLCDQLCRTSTVADPPLVVNSYPPVWHSGGFWVDYSPVIILSLAIATVSVIALIIALRNSRPASSYFVDDSVHDRYGSLSKRIRR